jgi:formylglycine-generating enzyme required for sulfatase activity
MSGNVWEWCVTEWQGNYKNYLKNEGKLNKAEGAVARVLRGGSYNYVGSPLRCAYRHFDNPDLGIVDNGFRVVVSSFPISLLRSGS